MKYLRSTTYVEGRENYITVGKIYKVIDDSTKSSIKIDSNTTYGNVYVEEWNFEPATKAEYLAQEGKSKEYNPIYIIGGWYKINNSWWAKFGGIENDWWIELEAITRQGDYRKGKSYCFRRDEIGRQPELLTDLSEIQQYLPENHPDKFPIDGGEEWIPKVGDWIWGIDNINHCKGISTLCKVQRLFNDNRNYSCLFPNKNGEYKNLILNIDPPYTLKVRKATPEEIASVTKPKDENIQYALAVEDEEQELIKEARRRGFVEGSEFQFSDWNNINRQLKGVVKGPIYQNIYNGSKRIVSEFGNGLIWSDRDGWATIVTPAPNIQEKLDWQVPPKDDSPTMVSAAIRGCTYKYSTLTPEVMDRISSDINRSSQDEQPILISIIKTSNKIIVL